MARSIAARQNVSKVYQGLGGLEFLILFHHHNSGKSNQEDK